MPAGILANHDTQGPGRERIRECTEPLAEEFVQATRQWPPELFTLRQQQL